MSNLGIYATLSPSYTIYFYISIVLKRHSLYKIESEEGNMRRKSTILSVAVTVMISLCLMLTGKVGFDSPAFAADKSKVYEIKLVTSNPSTDL